MQRPVVFYLHGLIITLSTLEHDRIMIWAGFGRTTVSMERKVCLVRGLKIESAPPFGAVVSAVGLNVHSAA